MAEFTKDEPFEFKGVKYARLESRGGEGGIFTPDGYGVWWKATNPEAIHAFIEAERDEWRWTNDEHTEARRGRWLVERNELETSKWRFFHDDLAKRQAEVGSLHDDGTLGIDGKAWSVVRDFLAWKSAQEQPEEPTGLGAAVEAGGEMFARGSDPDGPWVNLGDNVHHPRWSDICDRGPVTILSPGVNA